MGLMDFFTQEAGQKRRAWLNEAERSLLATLFGPHGRERADSAARLADMFNPVTGVSEAMQGGRQAYEGEGWDRVEGLGRMSSGVAATVAPAFAGKAGGDAVAKIVDSLLGWNPTKQAIGDDVGRFAGDEFGGIKAYHGSPHDFDQFSMDHIGAGEGAQVYGHGLYFAENPEVARAYQTALTKPHMGGVVVDGARRATPAGGGSIEDEVIRRLAKEMRMYATDNPGRSLVDDGYLPDTLDRIADNVPGSGDFVSSLRGSDVQWRPQGRMYEVNINADPDDFLDWDKPLREQPDAMARLREGGFDTRDTSVRPPFYGFKDDDTIRSARDAGIPGIKYLDQGSRGAAEGTRNYVVFDDRLIEIVKKYGIAVAAPLLGMSLADVEAFKKEHGT